MGCFCSKRREKKVAKRTTSAYLGLAMIEANKAAALMVGNACSEDLQQEIAERLIRKAKNDGCTVSVVDGCLYIDYKFVGSLPPGVLL
ncbi:unnamed protein product [Anisakis simplex]|uniref:Late endosomal/lysosomal adaptor and MAPK and MTOR activator 5 n=1 Tax=Anisakis simplex TaxID=6269 RepID=A0A0M3JYF8_ANISI|nr:unnamed protein product [Anisakis simplex]